MDAALRSGPADFLRTVRESIVLRVLVLSHLAGLSGFLIYSSIELTIRGLPFAVVAGLLYFCAVGVTATILIALNPAFGALLELTAASRLLLALAAAHHPELAAKVILSPLLSATLVIGGALVLRLAAELVSKHVVPAFRDRYRADSVSTKAASSTAPAAGAVLVDCPPSAPMEQFSMIA